jgi:hypothetical protein
MRLTLILIAVAACQSQGSSTTTPSSTGHEREPCSAGSACDKGLTCLSDRCVKVPSGIDCNDVAETLTSIELGNYAEPEERAPRVAALRAKCEEADLSKTEGQCILESRTREQLARCPQPLLMPPPPVIPVGNTVATGPSNLPPECTRYIAVLEKWAACPALPQQTKDALRQAVDAMKQSWSQLGSGAMPQAVGDACRQGIQAIEQGMKQFGC